MNLFQELQLDESQKASKLEVDYIIQSINKIYNEWKKTTRRINAVDIITTSVNKLSNIDAESIKLLHEPAKIKLAVIIMRCLDLPPWKPLDSKRTAFKKLLPLINKLQNQNVNTGSGGNLKEVIMTRFSAALAEQSKNENKIFVAYEPLISTAYLKFLFKDKKPIKIYRMQSLNLPDDFETLVSLLKLNQEKAEARFTPQD